MSIAPDMARSWRALLSGGLLDREQQAGVVGNVNPLPHALEGKVLGAVKNAARAKAVERERC